MAEMINLLLFLPLIFFFFLIIIKRSSSKDPSLPPSPYPWPIIGNLFELGNSPHIQLAKLAQVHGPLMSLRLGHRTLIVGSSPTAASEILKTHDQALSGRDVSRLLQGKDSKVHNMNLIFTDECDDGWRYLRNIYRTELFSAKALESHVEMREKKVMEMLKYLGSKENQKVVIRDVVFATASNMLGNSLMSMDLMDFEGNGVGAGMMGSIRRLAVLAGRPQLADLYPFMGRWDLQRWYKKTMDLMSKELWAVWKDTLRRKRNGSFISSGQKDFIDVLIEKGFTDEQINPMIQELFSGGTETTGSTIEWVIAELLKNQKVLQKLTDELTRQINGAVVKESDLVHLPYLEACFKEILRLHPPGPLLLPHKAMKTCEAMGYTIPKDSQIFVNVWAIGRDPKIWNDPLSFKPERFIESKVNYKGKDFEYLPFSSGRRMCPGQPMASKIVPLILASLILNFEWFLPNKMNPSEIDMDEELSIAMHKKKPLYVTLKRRERFKI